MKHLYLLSLSLFFLLTGCNQPKQYYEVTGMLHTPYQIKFEYTESLENEISAELQRYYHCLNPFDSTSVISQVNQNKDIEVDDLFIEVFNKAMEVSGQTNGIENYLIDIGGETTAKGVNPKGECWHIGITRPSDDPMGTNKELQVILLLCGRHGLATSGDYRNFYIKDGKKYAHTIDPRTGSPAGQSVLSATVIAADCMTADA